jgi:hypothetical protein
MPVVSYSRPTHGPVSNTVLYVCRLLQYLVVDHMLNGRSFAEIEAILKLHNTTVSRKGGVDHWFRSSRLSTSSNDGLIATTSPNET